MTLSETDEALTEANRIAHDPRESVEDRKAARVLVDFYLDQRLVAEFEATVGKRPDADEVAYVRQQFAAGRFPKRDLR